MNNILIDLIKMFFKSMTEEDFKAGLKQYGIDEENINKLWNEIKEV